MASHKDVVSGESSFTELLDGILYVVVDKNWLWDVKEELWKSNPDLLAILGGSALDLRGKSGVGLWVALHTVDPNNGDAITRGGGWWWENNSVSKSLGDSSCCDSEEVSHSY